MLKPNIGMCFIVGLILSTNGRPTTTKSAKHLYKKSLSGDYMVPFTAYCGMNKMTKANRCIHTKSSFVRTHDSGISRSTEMKWMLKNSNGLIDSVSGKNIHPDLGRISSRFVESYQLKKFDNKLTPCVKQNNLVSNFIQELIPLNKPKKLKSSKISDDSTQVDVLSIGSSTSTPKGVKSNRIKGLKTETTKASRKKRNSIFILNEHMVETPLNVNNATHGNPRTKYQNVVAKNVDGAVNKVSNQVVGGLITINHPADTDFLHNAGTYLDEHKMNEQDTLATYSVLHSITLPNTSILTKSTVNRYEVINPTKPTPTTTPISFSSRLLDILISSIDELYSITKTSYRMYRKKYFRNTDVDAIIKPEIPGIEWQRLGLDKWLKPNINRIRNHTVYLNEFQVSIQEIMNFEKQQPNDDKLLTGLKLLNVFCTRVRLKMFQLIRKYSMENITEDTKKSRAQSTSSENFKINSISVLRELRIYLHKLVFEIEQLRE